MQNSLSSLVDNLSEIGKKISQETLIKNFFDTYQLCNNYNYNLLFRKGVYPYEYMDRWEKINETLLPNKEYFNKEDITDEDYAHGQKVWNTFEIKNLGKYHDLYVQSDTSLLADAFEIFRDKCIEKYELYPAHFLSAPGLTWHACFKKIGAELELLTDNDILLMFEKGIRGGGGGGGMCQAICRYAKVNNKYINNYDKNKE